MTSIVRAGCVVWIAVLGQSRAHADMRPCALADLAPNFKWSLDQSFDCAGEVRDGMLVFTPMPGLGCEGMRAELRVGIWRPDDVSSKLVSPSDTGASVDRWRTSVVATDSNDVVLQRTYVSRSQVRGAEFWLERAVSDIPDTTERVTLAGLPRGDGTMLVLRVSSAGRCTNQRHPFPSRETFGFEVVRTLSHGPNVIADAKYGFRIDLPYDWGFALVGYCGNEFMDSPEQQAKRFFIAGDYAPLPPANATHADLESRSGRARLHVDVLAKPSGPLESVARSDAAAAGWTTSPFEFADGASGFVRCAPAGSEQRGRYYYRSLGSGVGRIMQSEPLDYDASIVLAAVKSFRSWTPEARTLDADGRVRVDVGAYQFTHASTWSSPAAPHSSFGGDCASIAVTGPVRDESAPTNGPASLRISLHSQADWEALALFDAAIQPQVQAAARGAHLQETRSMLRTADDQVITRTIRRPEVRLDAHVDARRAAAARRLSTAILVHYSVTSPSKRLVLSAASIMVGAHSEEDLAEMDRIMQSLRFAPEAAKGKGGRVE